MLNMYSILLLLLLLSDALFGQQVEIVQLEPKAKDANLYLILYPPQHPWKGVLYLIPGMGETPQEVLTQTHLPKLAAQQGLVTIIPTVKTGIRAFGVDGATQESLLEIITHTRQLYGLTDLPLYIGGFSIGGSCAIKYAQRAATHHHLPSPAAVFAIDPPLDFERFYHAAKRSLRLAGTSENPEARYMIGQIEQHMGGTPANALANYHQISPYSFSDTTQAAVKKLQHTPLLIYTEPDIAWWLSERNYDFTGMNALDAAAMINELRLLGNTEARLVTTHKKGFRQPTGNRHPHSWSIADPDQLVQWLLNR